MNKSVSSIGELPVDRRTPEGVVDSFECFCLASSLLSASSIQVSLVTLPVVVSEEVGDWAAGSGNEAPPVA